MIEPPQLLSIYSMMEKRITRIDLSQSGRICNSNYEQIINRRGTKKPLNQIRGIVVFI